MSDGGSGALLDTSVLVSPSGTPLPAVAAISVVSLGELRAGVLLAGRPEERAARRRRLDAVRSAFLAVPVDQEVADRYGDVLALARREGRQRKASDLLIIATAAAHGRRLHTADHRQARLAEVVGVAVAGVS